MTAIEPKMVPRMVCGLRNFQNAFLKAMTFWEKLSSGTWASPPSKELAAKAAELAWTLKVLFLEATRDRDGCCCDANLKVFADGKERGKAMAVRVELPRATPW